MNTRNDAIADDLAGNPGREHDAERQYRIGDLATEFGVTLRALRFYEDKGLLTPVRQGATRIYSHRDRARLKLILMGKRIGFPLNDIREMLNLYQPASGNKAQISLALKKGEKQLRVLMRQKRTIEEAIDELNRAMDSLRSAA